MNDLILQKMREGDWGAVVRLMREENERSGGDGAETPPTEPARPMPFHERFETVRITPQRVADSVVEEDGRFKALEIDGERFTPSQRFLKGMAQRMKVPISVFELFTPLEVVRRAAERAPDLQLRLTLDREEHKALALIEDKGVPMPAGNIEIVMKEDKRLQDFSYHDGIITGRFDLGEAWDIPNDSKYGVHISTEVPVDGMGTPETTLATWRQVCSNGAVAEAPLFRTKMEVKDNSGERHEGLGGRGVSGGIVYTPPSARRAASNASLREASGSGGQSVRAVWRDRPRGDRRAPAWSVADGRIGGGCNEFHLGTEYASRRTPEEQKCGERTPGGILRAKLRSGGDVSACAPGEPILSARHRFRREGAGMNWEVRQYQQEAVAACLAGFAGRGCASVMLESPVGSGKTYMALETIHALQELMGRKLKVDWVAPRRHLLRQVMEANRELHQDNIRPVSLFEKTPPEADFIVLDEAHHEATQSCVLLYEKMKCERVLGLSATPLRTDRMKLSFQETVTTCSIDRLIREGYLSPFHSYLLPHYGPQIVGECYMNAPEKWGKSLAFFPTVMECCQFQKVLAGFGVPCEVVTAESDKDRQLEEFVAGKVKVIANVSMLTEGFDQPDVQTIFARDASRLPTIQMCGRGLRRAEGKTHCNVVQSAKTSYLFERVTPAQKRFRLMNGQWMALQDGTEMIEKTLKLSLALLERRERMRVARKDRQRGGRRPRAAAAPPRSSEAMSFGERFDLPPFYRAFEDVYRQLYEIYGICNYHGWGGTLPPVALILNRSTRPTHVAGFAQMHATSVNGQVFNAISITLNICARAQTASFMPILLHEMTHIWQYAQGRRGGHGKDFRNEMLRLGIDEAGQCERVGSPFERISREVQMRYPGLAARLRECMTSPHHSSKEMDFAFFRMVIESPS